MKLLKFAALSLILSSCAELPQKATLARSCSYHKPQPVAGKADTLWVQVINDSGNLGTLTPEGGGAKIIKQGANNWFPFENKKSSMIMFNLTEIRPDGERKTSGSILIFPPGTAAMTIRM